MTPWISIGLFIFAIVALLWLLHRQDMEIQREGLMRDTQWAEQTIRLHMQGNQDFLTQLAKEISAGTLIASEFQVRASQHIANNPELANVLWIGPDQVIRWTAPYETTARLMGDRLTRSESQRAFQGAQETGRPTYTAPFARPDGALYIDVHVPVYSGQTLAGTVTGVYPVEALLYRLVPSWYAEKYRLSLLDGAGQTIVSGSSPVAGAEALVETIALEPPGHGVRLRASAYRTNPGRGQMMLVAVVIGLSLIIVTSLWMLRSHTLKRVQVEQERDRLFNLSLDLLCIVGLDGFFRRVNPAFAHILGYESEPLGRRHFIEFVHADDQAATLARLRELGEGKAVIGFENRCQTADGSYKWLTWTANPVVEEGLFYAVAHDITDRRQAEDQLRSEHAFRKAMDDSMLTGMRSIDMEGRITYVNAAFCRMTGWSEGELIGAEPPYPYWPQEEVATHDRNMELTLHGKMPAQGFEARFQRRNGEYFYARMYVSPLVDSTGQQTGWMASMVDITEQKVAREALQTSHQRFMTVLEGLDAAVYVADMQTDELLFVNRHFKNIYGHDVVGKNCWQVTRACQPDPAAFSLHGKLLQNLEAPVDLYDGELQNALSGRWYHVRDRAIRWVDGRAVRMEIATDITDRKHMDEITAQQQVRIEQTSRLIAMGEMASTLAHELNQPLAAIANYSMGCVNMLRSEGYHKEELLEAMQKASSQAERAGKIIRRVRDFVKKSEPRRSPCDMGEIVEEAVGFAEIEAAKQMVTIRRDIPQDLPLVFADRIMIEQVILNLVKNGIEAMHATEPSRRELTISAFPNGDGVVEVTVADRGPGIAPERAEQLFSPFYTTKPGGMGMGLNICRSIVEFHDGRLWASPRPGGGSIFHFTLMVERQS